MKSLAKVKQYWQITIIGVFVISLFGFIAWYSGNHEVNQVQKNTYFTPSGVEALDLDVNTLKVVVQNHTQIPLLDENSDYAYDGFISRANGTYIDVIFTLYDKTNSTLTNIPGIQHGPELIKILDSFIIYVNTNNELMVYARK